MYLYKFQICLQTSEDTCNISEEEHNYESGYLKG